VSPVATVEVGSERYEVRATTATRAERDRLFARLASTLPGLSEYAEAASREIAVVRLAPVQSES
jgi:hypothetical protein